MGAVTARCSGPPEPGCHFFSAEAAPGLGQRTFIAAFVNQDGLAVLLLHFRNAGELFGLPGHMRDVLPLGIVGLQAIMIAQQMMIRVIFRYKTLDFIPVLHRLGGAQVIFVAHLQPGWVTGSAK